MNRNLGFYFVAVGMAMLMYIGYGSIQASPKEITASTEGCPTLERVVVDKVQIDNDTIRIRDLSGIRKDCIKEQELALQKQALMQTPYQ